MILSLTFTVTVFWLISASRAQYGGPSCSNTKQTEFSPRTDSPSSFLILPKILSELQKSQKKTPAFKIHNTTNNLLLSSLPVPLELAWKSVVPSFCFKTMNCWLVMDQMRNTLFDIVAIGSRFTIWEQQKNTTLFYSVVTN